MIGWLKRALEVDPEVAEEPTLKKEYPISIGIPIVKQDSSLLGRACTSPATTCTNYWWHSARASSDTNFGADSDTIRSRCCSGHEVQQSPAPAAVQPDVLDGVMPLREQKMLGVFFRVSPPRFSWPFCEEDKDFLTTCQERLKTLLLVESNANIWVGGVDGS